MYSPTKAARVTGKSKNTIIKAIQSGRLAARQQKNGRCLIAPEQLEQVYPIAGQSERSPHEVHQGGKVGGEDQLDHEVASTASNDPMADRSPDDASFPKQAELMRLRGQLAEVTAGLTLNREQFRSMTDRIAAQLARLCTKKRSRSSPKNSVCGDLHQSLLNGQNVPSEVPNILSSLSVELQIYPNFVI